MQCIDCIYSECEDSLDENLLYCARFDVVLDIESCCIISSEEC